MSDFIKERLVRRDSESDMESVSSDASDEQINWVVTFGAYKQDKFSEDDFPEFKSVGIGIKSPESGVVYGIKLNVRKDIFKN